MYVDFEEPLNHYIENELSNNGSLLCIVGRPDLSYVVQERLRFPDWPENQTIRVL